MQLQVGRRPAQRGPARGHVPCHQKSILVRSLDSIFQRADASGDEGDLMYGVVTPPQPLPYRAKSPRGRDQSLRFGDVLIGSYKDELIICGLGVDTIAGNSGDDVLIGGLEHFTENDADGRPLGRQDRALADLLKRSITLESAVGRGGVCGCGGAGQGATTQNSQSIQGEATPPCAATTVQSAP